MNTPLLQANIHNTTTIPNNLLMQYGRLRYQCFQKNDPNVNMDHVRQIELDHFDQSTQTLYILITQSTDIGEELISAVRLIPTTSDYELEMESYQYLTTGVNLPKSPSVFEGNRWIGKSSNTTIGKLSTGILLRTLYQLSEELGFNQIIGTITTKGEAWLDKRNSSTTRNSDTYTIPKENIDILISIIALDNKLLSMANTLLADSAMNTNPVINNHIHTHLEAA